MGVFSSRTDDSSKVSNQSEVKKKPKWMSDYKVGDFFIMQREYTITGDRKDVECDSPRVAMVNKVLPDTLMFNWITDIVYDDVPYNRVAQDSKQNFQVDEPVGNYRRWLRRPRESELLSAMVPRVKGTKCEVFTKKSKYDYSWVAGEIIFVSSSNRMHVKTEYGTIVLPIRTSYIRNLPPAV